MGGQGRGDDAYSFLGGMDAPVNKYGCSPFFNFTCSDALSRQYFQYRPNTTSPRKAVIARPNNNLIYLTLVYFLNSRSCMQVGVTSLTCVTSH
jgi:hypothetical protein